MTGNDRGLSPAPDGDDDFEFVAVTEHLLAMPAARHDLAVTLERHALASEVELVEQLQAVKRLFEAASFAVNGKRDQCDVRASEHRNFCSLRALWQP